MSSGLALRSDPAPILACTVSRNVHQFDLLIEDMESVLGEAWGDLTFDEARAFLDQPDAADLEFYALAVTADDAADLGQIGELILACRAHNIHTVIVAHDLSPATLHELLRLGAGDFVPYPLAEGALEDAIGRMRNAKPEQVQTARIKPAAQPDPEPEPASDAKNAARPADIAPRMDGQAAVFAVQGLAGGTGASTLAVNLAWELASIDRQKAPRCAMDLGLQAARSRPISTGPLRDRYSRLCNWRRPWT